MSESLILKFLIIACGFLICCVVLIFLIRSILELIIYFSYKNYQKLKSKSQKLFPKTSKKFDKVDEELSRKKLEIPKAHSQTRAENIQRSFQSEYQILNENSFEEEKIVGIAKPLGFWTRKIFGERIATVIAQAESMKKGESTKFWQNFVKASRVQSRYQDNINNSR
ncbi:MAG: hypothetical protein EBT63_04830 [Proteobacteria bacterium]|nr:hypothetical protein [Pseudomonadota bacterium]NCA27902.1 hypothetical protein [Pseudomonadota bacterium]